MTEHSERAHAILGASSAHRWMACPGSVRASAGIERRASRYADEGTAAHQLAERCLRHRVDAAYYLGTVETVNDAPWEVTEEMAEAVQVFLDTVRADLRHDGDTRLLVEQRFDLSAMHPGMFGTNDACVIDADQGVLRVFDYKHGKGHAVDAIGNPQLRYYGLGALMAQRPVGIRSIRLTIVQPRAPHRDGPVRSETISLLDLLDWAGDLKRAALATEDVFAPLRAGAWCTFCPAAATCPALRDAAMTAAMAEFRGNAIALPAEPAVLDLREVTRLLDAADMIDSWLAAVRAHALHLAESGVQVPGYKLVPKRATRKWLDEAAVPVALTALGVPATELYEAPKLRSPARIESALPRALGKNAKERAAHLDRLVQKVSSGVNLVPDGDPRDARQASALVDFVGVV